MTETMKPVHVDWSNYDVPAIWAMIDPERETTNREQVNAWLRTSEMLASHQTNLQTIRDRLAERWPPTGSGASRQLLARIDAFIEASRAASEVTRTNASALSLLTDALMKARSQVEPLYRAWQSAASQQRVELGQRARAVMAQTDAIVAEHGGQFVAPNQIWWISREGPGSNGEAATLGRTISPSHQTIVPPLSTPSSGAGSSPPLESDRPSDTELGVPALSQAPSPSTAGRGTPPIPGYRSLPKATPGEPRAVDAVLELIPNPLTPLPPLRDGRMGTRGLAGTPAEAPIDQVIRAGRSKLSTPERSNPLPETPRITEAPLGGGILGGGAGIARQAGVTSRIKYPNEEEWAVSKGVSPVLQLEPQRKSRFDPGPNVIGLRR